MKNPLKPAFVFLVILMICLLPHKSESFRAYPENLWTNSGNLTPPSSAPEVLKWNRTEYGVLRAWLVHDSCTTGTASYVRTEPRVLAVYLFCALFSGIATHFLTLRRFDRTVGPNGP